MIYIGMKKQSQKKIVKKIAKKTIVKKPKYATMDLDWDFDTVKKVVERAARSFRPESKTFFEKSKTEEEIFLGLGQAMFNEVVVDALEAAMADPNFKLPKSNRKAKHETK